MAAPHAYQAGFGRFEREPIRENLFYRHGQPPDQARQFVQMFGIMIPHGLRQPHQAFVITHRGNVARRP